MGDAQCQVEKIPAAIAAGIKFDMWVANIKSMIDLAGNFSILH